jgi:hypothetical protein
MWHEPIRTSRSLWFAISISLFLIAGAINWIPESKDETYWENWYRFITGRYGCSSSEFVFILALKGMFLAVPCLVLGWVCQALARAAIAIRRRSTQGRQHSEHV